MQNENEKKILKEAVIGAFVAFMVSPPRSAMTSDIMMTRARNISPDMTQEEVVSCYQEARRRFDVLDGIISAREENMKRLLEGLPPAPPHVPSLVDLLAMLRAKKYQADKAHADRVQDMVKSGSGDKDSQCDDADCGRFTDAANLFAAAAKILQTLLDEECHINDAGEEVL